MQPRVRLLSNDGPDLPIGTLGEVFENVGREGAFPLLIKWHGDERLWPMDLDEVEFIP